MSIENRRKAKNLGYNLLPWMGYLKRGVNENENDCKEIDFLVLALLNFTYKISQKVNPLQLGLWLGCLLLIALED